MPTFEWWTTFIYETELILRFFHDIYRDVLNEH